MAAECGNAIAADGRGMPWKLQWFDVREISVAITLEFRGNCLGVPWQLPRIGELPWQLPRIGRGIPWFSVEIAVD